MRSLTGWIIGLFCISFLGVGLLLANSGGFAPDENEASTDRQRLWGQIAQAQKDKLPQTAMKLLEAVYQSAMADQVWPEAVRAMCQKISVEAAINQPATPFALKKLIERAGEVPDELKPMTNALLASGFHQYYRSNRWRFAQRSQTVAPVGDDFETWDLKTILDAIDSSFRKALEGRETLKKIPVAEYDQLLRAGNVDDAHRPTVFDFVANEAIAFYALDEHIVRQQNAFDLSADSPVLSNVDEFIDWKPGTDDSADFLLRAVRLYQELLVFHRTDADPTAFLDTDLNRIVFANRVAAGEEKTARYRAILKRFANTHASHELSCRALALLSTSYFADQQYGLAHRYASTGMKRFPGSNGGMTCAGLIDQIERPELSLSVEHTWNAAEPQFSASYRNLDKVHFRLIKFDYLKWQFGRYGSPDNLDVQQRKSLRQRPAIKSWSVELEQTEEFASNEQALMAPLDIPPGTYLLLASGKPGFDGDDNFLLVKQIWRSDLACVERGSNASEGLTGQVFDAVSGKPIKGVNVRFDVWKHDGRNSRMELAGNTTTDADGNYKFNSPRGQTRIILTHGDQKLGFVSSQRSYINRQNGLTTRTHYFTDRSIYRPGQTVHFKGICTQSNRRTDKYVVSPNRKVTVELRDMNNQIIEKQTFRSNEFGSFSGSFTAPTNSATGRMRLQSRNGMAHFRVEEYKRPKFRVEIKRPTRAFALGEMVSLTGTATAYTGASIDGAKVSYRVVRTMRYPNWWYWRCWWMPRDEGQQQLANGTLETKADGSFEIKFKADPDKSADATGQPVFRFQVFADVTDNAGETRSTSQVMNLGFTSLKASIKTKEWLTTADPSALEIATTTLDGKYLSAKGALKIYALTSPAAVNRARFDNNRYRFARGVSNARTGTPDLSVYRQWATGELIAQEQLETNQQGAAKFEKVLAAGAYKAVFETSDTNGNTVTAETYMLVVDLAAKTFDMKIPDHFLAAKSSWQPGETFEAIWGTGYKQGRAWVEIFHRGQLVKSWWTTAGRTLEHLKIPIEEKHRGGLSLSITFVRENRLYSHHHRIEVPWDNKKFSVRWEHFVSNLQPGGRETWTAVVSPLTSATDGSTETESSTIELSAIEMVAAMYDSSLDQYARHSWNQNIGDFYRSNYFRTQKFSNEFGGFRALSNIRWKKSRGGKGRFYRSYRSELMPYWQTGMPFGGMRKGGRAMLEAQSYAVPSMQPSPLMQAGETSSLAGVAAAPARMNDQAGLSRSEAESGEQAGDIAPIDLSQVAIRKNLNETAFFFPDLRTEKNGEVRIEFEVPEALTTWKFMGLAHDAELRTGMLIDEMTTSKDLMVQPNPPRFLRAGDRILFPVKVVNQSDKAQTGSVQLMLKDGFNEDDLNKTFGNAEFGQTFDVPARESRTYTFELAVPDFAGVVVYKAVAGNALVSDGEEGFLPVLSRRILVTESLPLPIRGNQRRTFDFSALEKMDASDSLKNQALTVQMTSNPSWYALLALPTLMEFPHECSEQSFNRLYANALGHHIVNSNDRINTIFQQWRGTDALDSPLEKNDDLRNVMIAESPWLANGKDESQARRNIGKLFDANRMQNEISRISNRLRQMQLSDGAWPWFPGGRANDYLTLYIATGYGRLRKMGVSVDMQPAFKAIDRLDWWMDRKYQQLKRDGRLDNQNLDSTDTLYLYGRTFYLKEKPVAAQYKPAFDYFTGQAREHWHTLGARQSEGHVAIALKRLGDARTPLAIMKSLTERALTDDEMGQFWREEANRWFWYRAPIETQAVMIEAFDEVLDDQKSVEELKVWLLKQKQTQAWKTTKSTADAVYALLLRGKDPLDSSKLVSVKIADTMIEPDNVEAGTGFYEQRFEGSGIKSAMRRIEVNKSDDGIAWGSIHWQYLEDVGKIKPYEGTPLTIKKGLFLKKNTDEGQKLTPLPARVSVGDELVTRVEMRVDRDMEYVHLKDYRGSGTEPVNVLSRYKSQDGLWYYESTRDTASHFFIDYLPRGTYVFEYSVRVQHQGQYQTGIAAVQCMYAPEFNSHSNSVAINVGK